MKKTYEQPAAAALNLRPGAPLALSVVGGEAKADSDFDVLSNGRQTPGQPWQAAPWAEEEGSGD
ncbi:MAG: hypothetical protein J1F06_07575 [Prevotellaceae bacterium]|nr:hypothetical protein [Prevotellaceae bacterium]